MVSGVIAAPFPSAAFRFLVKPPAIPREVSQTWESLEKFWDPFPGFGKGCSTGALGGCLKAKIFNFCPAYRQAGTKSPRLKDLIFNELLL